MYVTDDIRVQRGHYTRLWLYWFTQKHAPVRLAGNDTVPISVRRGGGIGNESVPIQSAQCWFPGLAISSAKIQIYIFQIKYTEAILSNSTRKLLRFEVTKMLIVV